MNIAFLVLTVFWPYLVHSIDDNVTTGFHYRSRSLKTIDWCNLNCHHYPGVPHTACESNGECNIANDPCRFWVFDKKGIVNLHNKLRHKFATGKDNRSPMTVSNMVALQWDETLALVASCHLMKCMDVMQHDKCRITDRFKHVGQNLATSTGTTHDAQECGSKMIEKYVTDWYEEIKDVDANTLNKWSRVYKSIPMTGHFSQVVWATTSHVGCAITKKVAEDKKTTTCLLACNYGPAGNMRKQSAFVIGPPGSDCPDYLRSHRTLPGLCTENSGSSSVLSITWQVFLSGTFLAITLYQL